MSSQSYRPTSWYDPRLEIRPSSIQGGGMFARELFQAGEIVAITCQCGTTACRHIIRGTDWQSTDVQQRYQGHFAPFINERIRKSNQR